MKKFLSILAICLCLLTSLAAQNIWKPFSIYGCDYIGTTSDGSVFAASYGDLYRFQSEGTGTTFNMVLEDQCVRAFGCTINKNDRIFITNYPIVLYSDDYGDSWQQTSPIPATSWVRGLYSKSNNVFLGWTSNEIFWTLDGGSTWEMKTLGYGNISCVLITDTDDVFASIYSSNATTSGIYRSSLSNMQNWNLAAFQRASIHQMIMHPDGSIIASNCGGQISGFHHEPGFYLIDGTTNEYGMVHDIAISDYGIVYHMEHTDGNHVKLFYSTDHGEHFYGVGEEVTITPNKNYYLYNGNDNHLYFLYDDYYCKKSQANSDGISGITGTLTKIEAPYFENNINNMRFAIATGDDSYYYTMIDGFWPNPDATELIIKYDTIQLGTEIEVSGKYYDMSDDNGNTFKVVDIQNHKNGTHSYMTGYTLFGWQGYAHITDVYGNPYYLLAIDGELQTEEPIVFNGTTINEDVHTFIGTIEIINGYDYPIFNLLDVFPGTVIGPIDMNFNTTITTNELYITTPFNEINRLSCNYETQVYFLTTNDKLINEHWYEPLWGEDIISTISGISGIHYDIYGNEFHTVEIRELESVGERSIYGQLEPTCYPPMGPYPPIGLDIAIVSDGFEYFIDNPHGDGFEPYCIIENDTLPFYQDIIASFSTSYMFTDGSNTPHFKVHIDDIWQYITSVTESISSGFIIYPNPTEGIIYVSSDSYGEYRITNIMGQTLMIGEITSENHQIDVSSLPEGMYFVTIGNATMKFMKK